MERRPLPGTRYALLSPLGEGAMGEVFLGEHEELGKRVVIKLLRPNLAARNDLVERFRREARVLAQIRHPSLVDIYDLAVAADGRPFFVMEYVEGANLRDYVASVGGKLEAPVACELLAQALDALELAHGRGVVHRDIKPENLLVARDGRLKILDFGVAKVLERSDGNGPRTAAGLLIGTPRYMSPEQAHGREVGPASDLYAIGCVVFELVTGVGPFEARTAQEMILAHRESEAPTMAKRAHSFFDGELEDLVAELLKKNPRDRPANAALVALQLRRIAARLSGRSTSIEAEKPTVQVDLDPAKIAATRRDDASFDATDAVSTTSGVSTPKIVPPIAGEKTTAQGEVEVQASTAVPTERLAVVDAAPTVKVPDAMAIAPTVKVEAIPSDRPPPPSHAATAPFALVDARRSALAETSPAIRTAPRGSPVRTVAIGVGVAAILSAGAFAIVFATRSAPPAPPASNAPTHDEAPSTTTSTIATTTATATTEAITEEGDSPAVHATKPAPTAAATKPAPTAAATKPSTTASSSSAKPVLVGGKPPALDDRD